ncbi:hypothetical protein ASB58_03775 [Pseudomonas abyssi]|uniref:Uncharacterized protein n=1 Tax=Pseudomonas abyssi TaxID=170540 RepID=A0A395R9N3_9PSED|nr:hypothetical protein ASB58_03775 [Halopseudomonas gallaeciensis]
MFALKLVTFAMFIEMVHLKCVKGVYWSALVQAIGSACAQGNVDQKVRIFCRGCTYGSEPTA